MDVSRIETYIKHLEKSIDANKSELKRTKDESIKELLEFMIHDKGAVINALEKQIPRKAENLLKYDYGIGGRCQVCGDSVREGQRYCSGCGQKLDWGIEM